MRSEEFVVPYGDHADKGVSFGEYNFLLENALTWSGQFGNGLVCNLYGGPYKGIDTELTEVDLKEYGIWARSHCDTIENELLARSGSDPDADRALNFHNFHLLNRAMLPMWHGVVNGEWSSEADRLEAIQTGQGSLALEGLRLFEYKLDMIRGLTATGENYFDNDDPALVDLRATMEGRLNEIDSGIELLEIAKRMPGSYVIPAPKQFEHGRHEFNSDFIFCDGKGKAIGVQSKTLTIHRNEQVVDGYNPRYVVVVDGSADLGNELFVRTERRNRDGSKNYPFRRVSWNGLVSAHYILEALQGSRVGHPDPMFSALHIAASRAREVVGKINSMNEHGVRVIGTRVLHSLGYEHTQIQELLLAAI